jgi:hypothetical protein
VLRRLVIAFGAVAVIGALSAPAASATTFTPTCANLQSTLNGATGAGDTVILSGLCSGSFTLPATTNNLTIQGAATGVNGFDGGGVTSAPALSSNIGVNGLTLRNLVFQNYASEAVHVSAFNDTNPIVVDGDTFANNHSATAFTGGAYFLQVNSALCPAAGLPITISNSTFTGNTSPGSPAGGASGADGGGGAAHIAMSCTTGGGHGPPLITVTNNTFSGNVTNTPSSGQTRQGGALWIAGGAGASSSVALVHQSNNLFAGNSVAGSGQSFAGGGEFTEAANITSTNDRFIGNSLPGATINTVSSEGAGLSTRSGGTCSTPATATSTMTNLVAAGNTIGAPSGTGGGGEGAGIYAGCNIGTSGYDLTLNNSTISGNSVAGGGVAGADGEAADHLHLNNTILIGNAGGPDIGGFGATDGANATAQNSDVCAIGSGSPFAGAGNICAGPALVNPAGGDIKETPGSPTIDRGDNSLVGVTTDVFGGPRILVGRPGDAAIVDMGAFEFKLPSNHFDIVGVQGKTLIVNVDSPGKVDVTQAGAGASSASALAVESKKKKKKKSKLLLNPSSASGGPGQLSIPLLLTKKGKQQLKKKGKVSISSTVSFTPTGGEKNSKTTTLQIKNKKKKKKKK